MFLYRYNVTCKTNSLTSIFGNRNIAAFLCTAMVFALIQSALFYYSAVDSNVKNILGWLIIVLTGVSEICKN
jgi:hypothetical protein